MGWCDDKLQELQFIHKIQIESTDGFAQTAKRRFQRILLLSAIDSFAWIARDRFDWQETRPGEVFRRFVSEFGGWNDANNISVAVIAEPRHEKHRQIEISEPLRQRAANRLPPLDSNGKCPLAAVDFAPNDLVDELPQPARLSHLHLLWDYRNTVMHEFHADPHWCEYSGRDDCNAHYANVMGVEKRCWKPCYPTGFLARLAADSLSRFERAMSS